MRGTMRLCAALSLGLLWAGCSNELKVSEVEPGHGTYTGGEEIVIKGNGFQPGRAGVMVKFGKRDATSVAVESASTIKVLSPAGDKNATVDVSVIFDDGRAFVVKNGFRYIEPQQAATMDKAFEAFGKDKGGEKK
jgi:hypothetical protein